MDLSNILIDNRVSTLNDYTYSLIQLKLPKTYEIFNLGVIISDESKNIEIKTVENIYKASECLALENPEGIEYALNILIDRVINYKEFNEGCISQSLFLSESRSYSSDESLTEALENLYNITTTIKKAFKEKNRTINMHDKPHILTNLRKVVLENKYTNIYFNKKVKNLHKNIDTTVTGLDEHDKEKIIIAAEVVSPHVTDFFKNFSESYILMQELMKFNDIKHKFLFMPKLTNLTKEENKNYLIALEIASNNKNIEIITNPDYQKFIHNIDSLGHQYNQKLF
ncbi:MAG: hypothetical protein C0625_01845 [Arcobacter sp.]|nr:MAG: hypothetical protein C0625_01845 [Arcobacter sp.]